VTRLLFSEQLSRSQAARRRITLRRSPPPLPYRSIMPLRERQSNRSKLLPEELPVEGLPGAAAAGREP
jgi:hypothetical protein